MKRITVVGGGITGLTVLYYLQKWKLESSSDIELTLVEKEDKAGGKIRTVHHEDFIMETGADSVVARHSAVLSLVKEIGLEEEMVYNSTGVSYLYVKDQLYPLPKDAVFGIPSGPVSLLKSPLISWKGKAQALGDYVKRNKNFTKESSVGEFLESFLGRELVKNQIAPVLSGVYSGDIYSLTMASTLPYLVDYKNDFGSIMRGVAKNKKAFGAGAGKKFISFRNGLSSLPEALLSKLTDTEVLLERQVEHITKKGEAYQVKLDSGESLDTDAVVIAAPHRTAAEILQDEEMTKIFNQFQSSSLLSVYAGFSLPPDSLPRDGTGFIVSENSDLECNACTWSNRKWTHTSKGENVLVRLFYKSSKPAYQRMQEGGEELIKQTALNDLKKSLHIEQQPVSLEVTDWEQLMPNYHIGHKAAVEELEGLLKEKFPGIYVAGASYYGVGIGACIQNGVNTAEALYKYI
ncbi:protoporphyrinogen oxidase [Marinococcus sp. PL1-022]|uniref:protoporphyrinogen oxidase n=1 Tax=Marinococcus sp. PL1-022 TaxID=3095363 RepID=UPI0029C25472|nr:protoporphyrinogen oxidase [Marinococcus sp. PL1-022]MDX6152184.1 protoporphyrinogen oxidase [Marinococcus sp. PL1-022]